ncbi:MAG: tetratricopeptide repeat protein [Lysobacter sp.]|nr:tetratricopeptide repeat protein [Lysobacter sp.]
MDPERWQRLSPLLDALFELEPDERERHLDELRGTDPLLAGELEQLITLDNERGDFLSEPYIPAQPSARPGTLVGPYQLERLLGEGGMGQVWLAARADGLYQHRVALKLLRPGLADPNLRLRFTRERQILAMLEHPHIARLLNAGISNDGQPYLALEYVEGDPITDYCRAHELSLTGRLQMFLQVCDAVSHAHANLIVHRDLKPSNIMVTPAGEARLLDFGIAKLLDTEIPSLEHTRTGLRAFTLHYAAPEQVRGEPVTTMTDVYSLGVVLYELLAEAKPYQLKRQTDAEWEEAILAGEPQRPSLAVMRLAGSKTGTHDDMAARRRRARALSGDLDNIILKALAKRPEQRYPSVEALSLDVQRHLDGKPVQARAQSIHYRVQKYVHRHRWALASTALIAAVLLGALGIVGWQARQAVQETARAQAMQNLLVGLFENAVLAPTGGPLDVHALLKAGEQRGNRELARQPRARAELLGVIAQIHIGLGDYREAMALLQRQSALIAGLPDAPPGLRLEAATQTGRVQNLLANPRTCIDTLQPMFDAVHRERGQRPLQVAEFYSQLGRCRRAIGESQTARLLFERSLAIRRGTPDTEVGVVENLTDLAALHSDAGESRQALRSYRAALSQLRATVGDRHSLSVDILRSIGTTHRELGQSSAAEAAYAEALALANVLQGPNHPSTLAVRRQLAAVHLDQGQLAQAEREFRATHALVVERLGPTHQDVGRAWNSLGIVAWERGDHAAARRDLQRAIAIWRQPAGAGALSGGLFNYAMILHDSGREDAALRALQESRRLRVAQHGAQSALVGDTDRLVGEVLAAKGNLVEARLRLNQAVQLLRADSGADHPRRHRAELALARMQAQGDEFPAAMAQFRRIIALPGQDAEVRKLHWAARAYAAEARCARDDVARGRSELDALVEELRIALPDGGVLPRRVAALRVACGQSTSLASSNDG